MSFVFFRLRVTTRWRMPLDERCPGRMQTADLPTRREDAESIQRCVAGSLNT